MSGVAACAPAAATSAADVDPAKPNSAAPAQAQIVLRVLLIEFPMLVLFGFGQPIWFRSPMYGEYASARTSSVSFPAIFRAPRMTVPADRRRSTSTRNFLANSLWTSGVRWDPRMPMFLPNAAGVEASHV